MKSKYTFIYNAQIEALLDSFITTVSKRISESSVAKYIEFVVLGGGYGRGEGGILQTENSYKLYNDLDFFVLARNNVSKTQLNEIDTFFGKLSKQLEPLVEIDVDFSKAVKVSYAQKRLNVMAWLEMALGANVIFGDNQKFKEIFTVNKDNKILRSEIVKLTMNRFSGLVFAYERLLSKQDLSIADKDFIARNINKAILATGDIYLACKDNLPFKTSDRLNIIENMSNIEHTNWQEFVCLYKSAVEFKMSPKIDFTKQEFEKRIRLSQRILDKAFRYFKFFHSYCEHSLSRRIKDFIILLKLKNLFETFPLDYEFYKKSVDPREKLVFLASAFFEKNSELKTQKNFSTYKKIWERLA